MLGDEKFLSVQICATILTLYPTCKMNPHLTETRVTQEQLKLMELQNNVVKDIVSGLIPTYKIGFVLNLDFPKLLEMKMKQYTRIALVPNVQLHLALTCCLVCLCSGQPRAKG